MAFVIGGGFCWRATAAPSPEDQAFAAAFNMFHDEHYPQAEHSFAEFLDKYTNSPHRPNAFLYEARSRLGQSNYAGAIDLLQKHSATVGPLQSEFLFWMAKAHLGAGEFVPAEQGYSTVAREFPGSPVRLESAYDEAEVHSRTADWPGVINILRQNGGPFQTAALQDPKSEFAARGWLLLAEALFQEGSYAEAEKVVTALDPANLAHDDLRWHRQYLLCRVLLAKGDPASALNASANLLSLDIAAAHQAASVFLQGQILEKLGRGADALRVYGTNLLESQPADAQQQAMARTIELTVAMNSLPQAIQALDALASQRQPLAAGQDLIRVSLGELDLKLGSGADSNAAGSNAPPGLPTNLLSAALTNFNFVLSNFTHSPLLPKARLDRGWCEWISTNLPAAREDFEIAAAGLAYAPDEAVARFKLADAQFQLKDFAGAAANYSLVLTNKEPEITNSLFDLALYQLAQADINRGDSAGASAAVEKILRWFPENNYGDRGSLLIGEDANRKYNYTKARETFKALLNRSTNSPLRAEVDFAIAQTFDHDGRWEEAVSQYKIWQTNHPGDPLLPAVQFHLALAEGKAGMTNEELAGLTNFVERYPTNAEFTPWALNSLADCYYAQGDWSHAEQRYQEVFQRFPNAGELTFEARFSAGKSALANHESTDAVGYFTNLVNLTNAPSALVLRGYLALGDAFIQQFQSTSNNNDFLTQAINATSKCTNGAPSNSIAVEALGRLGEYQREWADRSSTNYAAARQMYKAILDFPPGSVNPSTRAQAEVGLGVIAEREYNLPLALTHYINVVSELDPDHFDPYWVEVAGRAAGVIYEKQQHWNEAIFVYKRVTNAIPAMQPALEKKIAAAQKRLDGISAK